MALFKKTLKSAIKTSPLAQKAIRGYIRYLPISCGKLRAWNVVRGLEPPKMNFTARTVFGSRISSHTSEFDSLGRYIYYFGIWEPDLTRWMERRLKRGQGFIDLGANVGYFTLLASRIVGESGRVWSIEAHPALFRTLERNLEMDGAANVRAVNCAVWDAEEVLTIYTRSDDLPGQTTVMPALADKDKLQDQSQVSAAPLSEIVSPEEFQAVRLIKMDVEGAEWHVLSGMKTLMPYSRDDLELMIEVHPSVLEGEGKTCQDLLNLMADYGFHAYRIENEYTPSRYLSREAPRVPIRIRQPFSEQADIIFSRINAESL